jgi:hypothetical protein
VPRIDVREFLTLRDPSWGVQVGVVGNDVAVGGDFGPFPRVEPSASSKVPRPDTLDAEGAGWGWLNRDAGLVLQGRKNFKHLGGFFFFYVVEGGFYFFFFQ